MNIKPKTLFLTDSLGALLTAFMLGVILTRFKSTFGMPEKALFFLAFMACIYAIYSFLNYLKMNKNWRIFMKIIAIANLSYCCLTIGFSIYFWQKLTFLGLTYFLLEVVAIIGLTTIELKTAAKKKR